jgi:hypothetical protein
LGAGPCAYATFYLPGERRRFCKFLSISVYSRPFAVPIPDLGLWDMGEMEFIAAPLLGFATEEKSSLARHPSPPENLVDALFPPSTLFTHTNFPKNILPALNLPRKSALSERPTRALFIYG